MSTIHLTRAPDGVFPPDTLDRHRRDDLHVAVVHASGSDVTLAMACMTVLVALGKDVKVAGGKDHASDNTRWLPMWLLAHQVGWLVITDPHIWPQRVLLALLRILTGTPTKVLLAARHHAYDQVRVVADGFGAAHVEWDDVDRLLGPGQPARPDRDEAAPIDPPDSDWYRYRADCHALLAAEQYRELDTHYRHSFERCSRWLADGTPDPVTTADLLAELVVTAPGRGHALSRVRAAQAAFFLAGWNLRIAVVQLLKLLGTAAALTFTRSDWHGLRAYRVPYRPAIVALHQAGLPADRIADLTVGDIAHALSSRTLGPLPLCDDAAPFLTAQLLERATDSATADDPFVTVAPHAVSAVVNRAARDIGLLIGLHRAPTNPNTAMWWQYRAGFLLEALWVASAGVVCEPVTA